MNKPNLQDIKINPLDVEKTIKLSKEIAEAENRMETYKKWAIVIANMVYGYNGSDPKIVKMQKEISVKNAAMTLKDMIENERHLTPQPEHKVGQAKPTFDWKAMQERIAKENGCRVDEVVIAINNDGSFYDYGFIPKPEHKEYAMTELCPKCGKKMKTTVKTKEDLEKELSSDKLEVSPLCDSCKPEHKSIEELSGMTAKVKYKKDSPYNVNGEDEGIFLDLTEVHHNYKSLTGERDSTAFESDIEGTGATIKNKEIEEIEITVKPHLNSRNLLERFVAYLLRRKHKGEGETKLLTADYVKKCLYEFIESEGLK